jgi:hypothetical protein
MQIAPPPDNAYIQTLTSRIIEGRTITPYDYRAMVLPLYTTLSTSQPIGSATYTIPTNMRFRVRSILPHVAPLRVSAETIANPGNFAPQNVAGDVFDGGDVIDRLYAKAMNCRINIAMQSRAFDLTYNQAFAISDLMAENGQGPSFLDMPGLILQGTTIDLNAALIDTDADVIGSPTEYGIVLVGAFIRVD